MVPLVQSHEVSNSPVFLFYQTLLTGENNGNSGPDQFSNYWDNNSYSY